MDHIVIIGNGIAGITAARNIRKNSNCKVTVVGSESKFFYSRTALMYIFMGHMKFEHTKPYEDWFWKKNRIDLVFDHVDKLDVDNKELSMRSGKSLQYDALVLALGSKTAMYNWPGQDLEGVRGLYSLQDMDYFEAMSKDTTNAVIIGGGLIGVELAEMLHARNINVTMVIREKYYWDNVLPVEEATFVGKHIESRNIKVFTDSGLKEIRGNGRVSEVITSKDEVLECQMVGITTGVVPNISLVEGTKLETNRGILVDEYLKTNLPDIYAVGDCAEVRSPLKGRSKIEPVWYVGRMMGEVVGKTLGGEPTRYEPGVWFNSAKFLDLEYQTYGNVSAKLEADEDDFYWEKEERCIKIVFDRNTFEFKGINAFGIRLKHEVIDSWLRNSANVFHVVEHFGEANFDPEFYKKYDREIALGFDKYFPGKIKIPREKRWIEKVLGG